MRAHFVINPYAGRGNSLDGLTAAIQAEFSDWDIRIATDPPTTAACESLRVDGGVIVAVGGDGTMNRVLNSTVGSGVPLGILPCGTSNDLAQALGIPRDFAQACRTIRQAHRTAVDLVKVNDAFFATCGGIGLPAAVAVRANRWRQTRPLAQVAPWLGRGVYPLTTICALHDGAHSVWASLSTSDGTRADQWMAVTISNQPRFGGFSVAPLTSNRDGILDLCAIRAPQRPCRLLDIVRKAWQGRPQDCPEMSLRQVRAVNLFTRDATPFMGDGEILQEGTEFRIRIVPAALRVIVPKNANAIPTLHPILTGARPSLRDTWQETRRCRCG